MDYHGKAGRRAGTGAGRQDRGGGGMTIEQATLGISVIVLVMQGVSIYTTAKVKVWAMEKFVSKSDFLETLHFWSKSEKEERNVRHS